VIEAQKQQNIGARFGYQRGDRARIRCPAPDIAQQKARAIARQPAVQHPKPQGLRRHRRGRCQQRDARKRKADQVVSKRSSSVSR
jgi:hypothetical protein